MGDKSKIEWTDSTWNPITGCSKVSHGCKNCYAERVFPRVYGKNIIATQSANGQLEQRPRRFTDVLMHPARLAIPLRWKRPRRIFVNSMSDLFHESMPFEFIASVFAIMGHTSRHTYQVLTKRPQRMLEFFHWVHEEFQPHDFAADDRIMDHWPAHIPWESQNETGGRGYDTCGPNYPYNNVWLGVSVEDQATADERIPLLLATPAAVRWISAEPLLGPIDFNALADGPEGLNALTGLRENPYDAVVTQRIGARLDWVVAGGESGPNARPSHPDWFRSLRDQCQAAGVPFFFKQWGQWHPCDTEVHADERGREIYPHDENLFDDIDRKGGFSIITAHDQEFFKAGKKLSGRALDGRTWDEYPGRN